MMIMVITKK